MHVLYRLPVTVLTYMYMPELTISGCAHTAQEKEEDTNSCE